MNFSRPGQKYFSRGGPKVAKFDFTHSKLRKRPFFAKNLIGKCQISNSRGALLHLPPLPTLLIQTTLLPLCNNAWRFKKLNISFSSFIPLNSLSASLRNRSTACHCGVRRKFSWGGFIQRHRVVICIWCALFVTSQFDVIVLFPNQRFSEVR